MSMTLGELNAAVARLAPPAVAESWDNAGLQIGDPAARVDKALVALEVSQATHDEAEAVGATALITHHPLIFRPLKSLRGDRPVERLAARLIRSNIGLIAAHTNLDKSECGPNHALAAALGITVEGWLRADARQEYVKLVVFTPEGHEAAMIEAIAQAGGGVIGNYTHCTFRTPGTGTFLPGAGTNPFIGEAGRFEETREWRLESLVPRAALGDVLRAVRQAHPYEEPALDVLPAEIATSSSGLGIVGRLESPITPAAWEASIDAAIRPLLPKAAAAAWGGVHWIGVQSRPIQRIAICSGSGGSLAGDAADAGADLFLTGEMHHHDAIDARERGLAVAMLGHFASEAAAMPYFADALRAQAPSIEFLIAQSETDPMGA